MNPIFGAAELGGLPTKLERPLLSLKLESQLGFSAVFYSLTLGLKLTQYSH